MLKNNCFIPFNDDKKSNCFAPLDNTKNKTHQEFIVWSGSKYNKIEKENNLETDSYYKSKNDILKKLFTLKNE